MFAVTVTEPGGPEVLQPDEVPQPVCGPSEVLIEVAAAGVNRADLLQRQGLYPPPPGESEILGLECSGIVREVGEEVHGVQVGEPVCALLAGGGYAQYVRAPAGQVMPVPEGIDLISSAGLPEVAATVYSNLALTARLAAGETVLLHGGASGIGTFAIQWARARGCEVIVTVGSAAKADFCLELGANTAIDYRSQDFGAEVERVTKGHGVDVILDIIGAKYLEANIRALAADGRLVIIGLQGGVRAELDLARLLAKRGSIFGTSLRSRSTAAKAQICRDLVAQVWPMVSDGRIRPIVDDVLPWTEASAAHEILGRSSHRGKVILAVNESLAAVV